MSDLQFVITLNIEQILIILGATSYLLLGAFIWSRHKDVGEGGVIQWIVMPIIMPLIILLAMIILFVSISIFEGVRRDIVGKKKRSKR